MMAVAVNCLPTDPDWNKVSGLTGTRSSTLAKPKPWARTISPLRATSSATPGMCCRVHLRVDILRDRVGVMSPESGQRPHSTTIEQS